MFQAIIYVLITATQKYLYQKEDNTILDRTVYKLLNLSIINNYLSLI
jgi:hypothetical protein